MGAGIMLLCGNKTLIMKRTHYKYDKWSGYWDFPGGKGELNETTYQTALRETEEETGIDSDQYQIVNHVETRYYTMYVGVCKTEIEPTLDHEHIDWKWVRRDMIPKIKSQMHPKDWGSYKKYYKIE
jgi:8-oxo-dGTP pyrophosphatase MutT (NUDIX family)